MDHSARHRSTFLASFLTLPLAMAASVAFAGPLNPPAGAIVGTGKTLTEVEPRTAINAVNTPGDGSNYTYRITQPGSYYLTGDLVGTASDWGIQITASDVTIDLNGFTLRGVPGAIAGIVTDAGRNNITVRNGTIANWPFGAVIVTGSGSGASTVVEDVRCISNGGQNIVVGVNSRITRCLIENAGSYGIYAPSGKSIIESCTVRVAGFYGIIAHECSIVRDCTVSGVNGVGIAGIAGSVVSSCSTTACTTGVYVEGGSTVTCCTARANTSQGFYINLGSTAVNNNALGNGTSIADGAGMIVSGADNRIEGNTLTGNDKGVRVESSGNIIIRNTASGNTVFNWDIVPGNAVAPIVSATTNAAAISGNTYTGSLGSTDPNANFTY